MKLSDFAGMITQELKLRTRLAGLTIISDREFVRINASLTFRKESIDVNIIDMFREYSSKIYCQAYRLSAKEFNQSDQINFRHSWIVEPNGKSAQMIAIEVSSLLVPEMHRSALEMLALSLDEEESDHGR
jgi:hypothetical protein